MGDEARQFKIRFVVDAQGGITETKAAGAALQETGQAAKQTGEQVLQGAKQADVSHKSHKELHAVVKGLKEGFPELGHAAHLALNPIVFSVASIGAAWALWNARVEECERLLGAIEMPDIGGDEFIGQLGSQAQAWKEYADKISDAKEALNSVNTIHAQIVENLKQEEALLKSLLTKEAELARARVEAGKSTHTPEEYERAKADTEADITKKSREAEDQARLDQFMAKVFQMVDLRAEGRAKKQEADDIHVGSKEEDADIQKKLDALAEAAKKDLEERQQRISDINAEQNPSERAPGVEGWMQVMRARWRQMMAGPNVTMEEMRKMEEEAADRDWQAVHNADEHKRGTPERDAMRKRKADSYNQSADAQRKADEIERGLPDEENRMNRASGAAYAEETLQNLINAYKALAELRNQTKQMVDAMNEAAEHGGEVTSRMIEKWEEQQKAAEAMQRRIDQLEEQMRNHPPAPWAG